MYGHQRGERRAGGTNILPMRDSLQGEKDTHRVKGRGTRQESIGILTRQDRP